MGIGLLELDQYLLERIINRLEDAKPIAIAQCVCKEFRDAGNRVRSLRFNVLKVYHDRARNMDSGYLSLRKADGGELSSSRDMQIREPLLRIMDQIVQIIKGKECIEQLHIHTHPKLQAKTVPEDERQRTDFWLSDPYNLKAWLPPMKLTLEHLGIVDYGQQAILHRSSIIKILSQNCKRLKTLDLRNMFIDTSDCEEIPSMVSLTLRCVKVTGGALEDVNHIMPKLQTLALFGVFGVERANLKFHEVKVLYLGLSTPAKDVELHLPKLEKLQLKMPCPKNLIINAPILKYVAFNLEVMKPSKVELKCTAGVQELVYGASSIITLSSTAGALGVSNIGPCDQQPLDLPCSALLRDGRYLDMLDDEPIFIPSFSKLHECNNQGVSYTPLGRAQHHGMWPTPDGLSLLMSEAGAQ